MTRRHPNGRELTDEELETLGEDLRDEELETLGEDLRDEVDDDQADWLAADEFRGRW